MADGASYEGQVDRNRAPNGEGVLTCPNGIRFDGSFVAGKMEGHGVMTSRDGARYEGQVVNGESFEGQGTFTFVSAGNWPTARRGPG